MVPQWLIIAVGVALILALAWPFVFMALAAGIGALVAVALGILTTVEKVLTRVGFYRWQHQRRLKTGYYSKRVKRRSRY